MCQGQGPGDIQGLTRKSSGRQLGRLCRNPFQSGGVYTQNVGFL